jgi:hypothetical protein
MTWLSDRRKLLAFMLALCSFTSANVVALPPSVQFVDKVISPEGPAAPRFGNSITISDEVVIISQPQFGPTGNSAKLHIFNRDGQFQNQLNYASTFRPRSPATGAVLESGPLAIWNDIAILGSPDDAEEQALILKKDLGGPNNWGVNTVLKGDDSEIYESFGQSADIFDTTVVVGAYRHDHSGQRSGAVYVFDQDQGGADKWGQTTELRASDESGGSRFGQVVAIDGNTILVGAELHANTGGKGRGAAYIFERDANVVGGWSETAKLTASDGRAFDFGATVALFGNTAIVGVPRDSSFGSDAGAAYVFERPALGAAWQRVAKLTASDAEGNMSFGTSVDVYGDFMVVGAMDDDAVANEAGSAYVFHRSQDGQWREIQKLTAPDGFEYGWFGWDVALYRDLLVIGSPPQLGGHGGAVYVYRVVPEPSICTLCVITTGLATSWRRRREE